MFSGVGTAHEEASRRETHAHCYLLTAHYVYGPCGGLSEHTTQALCKSTNGSLTKLPWVRGRRTSIAASTRPGGERF